MAVRGIVYRNLKQKYHPHFQLVVHTYPRFNYRFARFYIHLASRSLSSLLGLVSPFLWASCQPLTGFHGLCLVRAWVRRPGAWFFKFWSLTGSLCVRANEQAGATMLLLYSMAPVACNFPTRSAHGSGSHESERTDVLNHLFQGSFGSRERHKKRENGLLHAPWLKPTC